MGMNVTKLFIVEGTGGAVFIESEGSDMGLLSRKLGDKTTKKSECLSFQYLWKRVQHLKYCNSVSSSELENLFQNSYKERERRYVVSQL